LHPYLSPFRFDSGQTIDEGANLQVVLPISEAGQYDEDTKVDNTKFPNAVCFGLNLLYPIYSFGGWIAMLIRSP
jgi:hypothetical protein